ncbi:helix-turn-helix domain-containing protein, partial [Corynebacterium macginleyi]
GRKPALNPEQVAEIKRRVLAGESKAALAREFGVTRPTVYRALKNA